MKRIELTFLILILLFASSLQTKANTAIQYLFPKPDAKRVADQSNIIVRYDRPIRSLAPSVVSAFKITGSQGGEYPGKAILSDDNRTVVYEIDRAFHAGEVVNVQVPISPFFQNTETKNYQFKVSNSSENNNDKLLMNSEDHSIPSLDKIKNYPKSIGDPFTFANGVTIPSDFPRVDVRISENPSPGYLFTSTFYGTPYIMILNNDGMPVFYKRMQDRPYDFKRQPTGVLTHYDRNNMHGFVVMDSTYQIIDTIKAKHGYGTDDHELRILPNGHILLLAVDNEYFDMSKKVDGGQTEVKVRGNHVQELDASGNVVFEWRCWDHYDVTDVLHQDLTAPIIDFTHMNSIDVDHDGNLIISTRNLSEITKINRETGEIMWRFGGVNNQFDIVNDSVEIDYQHAVRALPNGNYILFDNGRNRQPHFSRVVEYKLDTEKMTATLEWQHRHDPDYYTNALGNAQRLPNGNTLINWAAGNNPKPVEVRPDGSTALEFMFNQWVSCYRILRSSWQGKAAAPYLVAESWSDKITLIFNMFGHDDILYYNVYADTKPYPVKKMTRSKNSFVHLKNLENHKRYYFRVTAMNTDYQESEFSNQAHAIVRYVESDSNLLLNGDFSEGKHYWTLIANNTARATGLLSEDKEFHIEIDNGGSNYSDIQLVQNNVDMVESHTYQLEFDAWAERDRPMDIKIEKIYEPFTNYGKISMTLLTQQKQHFSYQFKMKELSDYQAQIAFQCGGSPYDVYLDNITLREIETGAEEKDQTLPQDYQLFANYPNPFNSGTTLCYKIPVMSDVRFRVYNILGEKIARQVFKNQEPGSHEIRWSAETWSSGIYFCRMQATSQNKSQNFTSVVKMTVIK